MHEHAAFSQETQDQVFLGHDRWYAQHSVPATICTQQFAGWNFSSSSVECLVITANATLNLLANGRSTLEKLGCSELDWCRHRKICVGRKFQTRPRANHCVVPATDGNPGQLGLRQRDRLRESAECEAEDVGSPEEQAARRDGRRQLVIGKHFVRDDGGIVFPAERGDRFEFGRVDELARWIVGAHEQHGARSGAECPLDAPDVDGPGCVVLELVRNGHHRIEARQVIEQRIARMRNQHLVAGSAQQFEQQRIGFARTRCQRNSIDRGRQSSPFEISHHRLTGLEYSQRFGRVDQTARVTERRKQIVRIRKAGTRGIRRREIEDRLIPPSHARPALPRGGCV